VRGEATLISGYDALPLKPYNITNCWVVAMPTHELDDPKAYSDDVNNEIT